MTLSTVPPRLRNRLAPVCVAVTGKDAAALFQNATAALGESHFLELRLDALPLLPNAWEDAVVMLRRFCAANPQATVLATCRRVAGGGGYAGSAQGQLSLLLRFASAGAALVDVELETLREVPPDQLSRFGSALAAAGASLLASAHDFSTTGDLDATLAELRTLAAFCRPDAPLDLPVLYKVVATARELGDTLRMLRFIESASREVALVGICMGAAGFASRVLALRAGALFTFAAAAGGASTAPGQVSAAALLNEYRVAAITGNTEVYGVAGNPVTHSLSPALHNAGFRAAGIDAVYLPLHTTSVRDLLALAHGVPLAGFSVTMPWKVDILPCLDATDPLAASIGAVNTVVCREHGSGKAFLSGANTDADAIVEPLKKRLALPGARVLLLGAGGAARAAAFALRTQHAEVFILNRTVSAAERLAQESGAKVADRATPESYDVVVHATPAGMLGHEQALLIDAGMLRGVRVLFEMVYRPADTPFTRLGESLGIEVIYGLEMFMYQGARQWELWTGQTAPEAAMRQALETALRQQS